MFFNLSESPSILWYIATNILWVTVTQCTWYWALPSEPYLTVCCIINWSYHFLQNVFVRLCSGPKQKLQPFGKGSVSDKYRYKIWNIHPRPARGPQWCSGTTPFFWDFLYRFNALQDCFVAHQGRIKGKSVLLSGEMGGVLQYYRADNLGSHGVCSALIQLFIRSRKPQLCSTVFSASGWISVLGPNKVAQTSLARNGNSGLLCNTL